MSNKKNVVVRILENDDLIEDACALLHKVYVEDDVWKFSPNNPSKLREEIRNHKRVLVDRFTESAIWFGAFDESQLVGCLRLTFSDENNKLEIESYRNSIVIHGYLPVDKSHCVEMTRAAVLPSHNGQGIVRSLFLAAFQYCEDNQYSVCAASNNGYIIALFKNIGCPLKVELAFKYEEQDPMPVNFYFADHSKSEIKDLILSLKSYKKGIIPNNAKIFDALETVAPILPTLIYWHDTNGAVLGLNAICAKSMGVNQNIIGKTPYEFYPKEIAEHILKHNEHIIRTGEISSQDEEITKATTGEVKIFRSTKAPMYNDEGEVIGIIGSSIDVTAEKEAEKALRIAKEAAEAANEVKLTFIENMQHDLRTPAFGVASALHDLVKSGQVASEKGKLALIYKSAKQLYHLCLEVTDFDKLEHGERPIISKKFELKKLVKSVIDLNQTAAYKKSLELIYDIEGDVPSIVKGDNYRIKRILINLIGNSIKFTKQGQVKVIIKKLITIEHNKILRIEIHDTGIGIPQDKIEFIYEKFTRGTPSNQGTYKGIGLGLRLVKNFVSDLSGDLEVISNIDKGTTFYVTIPLEIPLSDDILDKNTIIEDLPFSEDEDLEENTLDVESSDFDDTESADRLVTLLIEDHPLALMAAKNALQDPLGCVVTTADSVETAKNAIDSKKFDVIVSDIGLPDGTGFDIAKYIKSNPQCINHKTPIFALTAHGGKEKVEEAENAGFIALQTKPLDPKKFKVLLDTHVRKISHEVTPDLDFDPHQHEKIIDLDFSKQYRLGKKEIFELLEILSLDLPNDLRIVKKARAENDIQGLRDISHKIKGGFCYVGVHLLQKATNELHDALREGKPLEEIAALFDAFYLEAEKVLQEYERMKRA